MVTRQLTADEIRNHLREYVAAEVVRYGTSEAIRPGHSIPFHWPPHSVALDHHVRGDDFKETDALTIGDETFTIRIAETRYGVFGRIEELWNDAKGSSRDDVKAKLAEGAEAFLARGRQVAELLGYSERFKGSMNSLDPLSLLKLLYARDRDIAREALTQIETSASQHVFGASLIEIIDDAAHPYRRSAQWCALDLFEDLPSFCVHESQQLEAIAAIKKLLWTAPDDFARTIYKAGVVLGGHIPHPEAGNSLLASFEAPSRIGRRAAYHASFHLAQWMPERRNEVVEKLRARVEAEQEVVLNRYIVAMARDVEREDEDHIADPLFEDES